VINGPVLHEVVRSAAREREREANTAFPDGCVTEGRTASGVSVRIARVWNGIWRSSTAITGGRRRHRVLRQHDEFEGR
jgi:hypothetical protein